MGIKTLSKGGCKAKEGEKLREKKTTSLNKEGGEEGQEIRRVLHVAGKDVQRKTIFSRG